MIVRLSRGIGPSPCDRVMTIAALVFILLQISHIEGSDRHTRYACEGSSLDIECEEGTIINLVRANFGRFSIGTCNQLGNTSWSTNCIQPKTLRILSSSCGNRARCSVEVSSSVFEDPCPGTLKYLEVHYTCQHQFTTTTETHAQPPWLLDLAATPPPPRRRPTTTMSTTTTTSTTTTISTTAAARTAAPTVHSATGDKRVVDGGFSGTFDHLSAGNSQDDDQLLVIETLVEDHCRPISIRGLFWNWTRSGQLAIQTCPPGSSGFAKWRCGGGAADDDHGVNLDAAPAWFTGSPDLSECESIWLTRLRGRLVNGDEDNLLAAAAELADSTGSRALFGGDMPRIAETMAEIIRQARHAVLQRDDSDSEDSKRFLSELIDYLVVTASNLLEDGEQMLGWSDLIPTERAEAGTALLHTLQDSVRLVAGTINQETEQVINQRNVDARVRVLKTRDLKDQDFQSNDGNVAVQLTTDSLIDVSSNGAVRLLFIYFNNIDHILPSSTNGVKFLNSQVVGVTTTPHNLVGRSSGRYAASRYDQHSFADADDDLAYVPSPVATIFKHDENGGRMDNPSCVWWDWTSRTWTDERCQVVDTNLTHTQCLCEQAPGLMAVLMEQAGGGSVYSSASPHARGANSASTMTVVIAAVVSVVICIVTVTTTFIIFRRFARTKALCRSSSSSWPCMESHQRGNGGGSNGAGGANSSGSAATYYPYLSSSTTTTTLTPGTPGDHQHDTLANNGQYCMANDCQVLRPLMITPLGPNSTIYRATFANGQQAHVIPITSSSTTSSSSSSGATANSGSLLHHHHHQTGNVGQTGKNFRPITPSASHIYMEIDPVYNSETMSDILVSDLSDDDLRRSSSEDSRSKDAHHHGQQQPGSYFHPANSHTQPLRHQHHHQNSSNSSSSSNSHLLGGVEMLSNNMMLLGGGGQDQHQMEYNNNPVMGPASSGTVDGLNSRSIVSDLMPTTVFGGQQLLRLDLGQAAGVKQQQQQVQQAAKNGYYYGGTGGKSMTTWHRGGHQ